MGIEILKSKKVHPFRPCFLHKYITLLQKAPRAVWSTLYASKSPPIFPAIIKLWRARTVFLYNSDCIHLKEESCGVRVSKGERGGGGGGGGGGGDYPYPQNYALCQPCLNVCVCSYRVSYIRTALMWWRRLQRAAAVTSLYFTQI